MHVRAAVRTCWRVPVADDVDVAAVFTPRDDTVSDGVPRVFPLRSIDGFYNNHGGHAGLPRGLDTLSLGRGPLRVHDRHAWTARYRRAPRHRRRKPGVSDFGRSWRRVRSTGAMRGLIDS